MDESNAPVGGNPVEGLAGQGESDFASVIGTQDKAQSPGAAQTGGTKPRSALPQKDVANIPEGEPSNPVVAPVKVASPAPSQADLIRDTVAATAAAFKQTAAPTTQQRQRTPQEEEAEFNQKYGVVRIDPTEMAQLFDQDPKKAAAWFENKLQAVARQALLMGKELGSSEIGQIRAEYEPKIKAWDAYQQRQYEEKIETDFYKEHADLADERDLVETVKSDLINRVKSGQLKFPDQKSANNAVAEATRKIVARMNKPVTPDAQQTPGAKPTGKPATVAPAVRQMSGASSPGRSGTGKAAALTDAELVFGTEAR